MLQYYRREGEPNFAHLFNTHTYIMNKNLGFLSFIKMFPT